MNRIMTLSLTMMLCGALIGWSQEEKTHRKASPEDYKKLAGTSSFRGKLGGVGPKSVSVYLYDPAVQKAYDMQLAKAKLMKEPQKSVYEKKLEASLQNSSHGKEYEFELTEKAHLRKLNIGFEYDDKGNPVKNDPKRMAILKGDTSKPGYVAKAEDLTVGSQVTVYLTKSKDNKLVATMVVVNNKVD